MGAERWLIPTAHGPLVLGDTAYAQTLLVTPQLLPRSICPCGPWEQMTHTPVSVPRESVDHMP